MEIVRLRSIYQNLEKKNKELLLKLEELTKKNNLLSKENISLKYSQKINTNIEHNIEELNKKILKVINEKNELEKNYKKLVNINNELIQEKNDLKKKLAISLKENQFIDKNMKEMCEIKDNFRDKYKMVEKELNNEKQKLKILQKKLDEINNNINDNNMNNYNLYLDDQKTKSYKNIKLNKIPEIEIEKLTKLNKISQQSPQYIHRSTSRFSTNNTSNTKKVSNNLEDIEITPDNYNIIKVFKINNLKWFLLKKIKNNISQEKEDIHPLYRRYQYLKLNSNRKKENNSDDSYSNYLWVANKEEKDFANFNLSNLEQDDMINNEKEKKINELQKFIKELNEKLAQKEKDYNRINLNYAKLFKKTKKPEMTYDIFLEENYKLKNENKLLNKKIEKLKENQKFIGISFIGDDLENSTFIDDKIFENILEDITKNRENKKEQEIITMKCFISNEDDKNHKENIKQVNNNINKSKENKRKSYKDMENDINKKNQNIIKRIKTEYIKDILTERKKSNEKIQKEKEKDNNIIKSYRKEKHKEENDNEKNKVNNFNHLRYHKSIKNTRNTNTENDFKNEKLNSNEASIYKKINPKSFNFDSTIKIGNKEKRIITSRKKHLKESKEIYIKSLENK